MSDDLDDPPETNRRDLIKGVFVGGITGLESSRDAIASLVTGGVSRVGASPNRSSPTSNAALSHLQSPIPVRATESVSIKEIAANTSSVAGPPYKLSAVADERGLLNTPHPKNPREDPPFAFRELITNQTIADPQIRNTTRGNNSWKNWVGDHGSSNLTKFQPNDEQDLLDAVLWNAREEKKIRAVGSGHSHSKVAAPDQSFIELSWYPAKNTLDGLIRKHNHQWLDSGVPTNDLRRIQAGATIKYLNRHLLLNDGKALINQGSFDGQTLAGAINTGTHGTGARIGSLADTVKSLELITVEESPTHANKPLVRKYRIEPASDPITDRRTFEDDVGNHGVTLIQNDEIFHSVVVGYGVMGVTYEYTIQVRDKYFLHEDNETKLWNDFKNDISTLISAPNTNQSLDRATADSNYPTGARHFQFRLNLAQVEKSGFHKAKNPRGLLVSHREIGAYNPSSGRPYARWPSKPSYWKSKWHWPPEREQKSVQQWFRKYRKKYGRGGFHPKKTSPFLPPGINSRFQSSQNNPPFEGSIPSISAGNDPGPYMTASYIALRRKVETELNPEAEPNPPPPAISTEIAVPADQVVKAVEAVIQEVIDSDYAYNVPMGVRFVARSPHILSPEYSANPHTATPVAKVEVPFLVREYHTRNIWGKIKQRITRTEQLGHADKALRRIENKLIGMANQGKLRFARPHMGKTNHLTRQQLANFYPQFQTWQAIHETFDAFGTFNNGFTKDKGIDIPRP